MMRNKLNRQYDLAISLFLSVVIAGLFIWWNPINGKYKLTLLDKVKIGSNDIVIYDDLDFDGNSEKIRFVKDFIGRPALLVEENGKILFQWNLTGKFAPGIFYHFADYNGNGRKEIFVFTYENDSIFLDAIDVKTEENIVQHKYITNYREYKGLIDFSVYKPMTLDLNADGKKEIVFSFACAFSHITRKLCKYDIENNILHLSEKAGCCLYSEVVPFDLDEDGKYEFIGTIHSPGNSSFEYPYTDQNSWLMVFDDQMNYKFPPKKVGKYSALLWIKPFKESGRNCLASFYHHVGKVDTSNIALYDSFGKLIRIKMLTDNKYVRGGDFTTFTKENQYKMALYRKDGGVEVFNDKLVVEKSFESVPYLSKLRTWDVNADGVEEFLFIGVNRDKLIITSHDYSDPVIFSMNEDISTSYFSNEWVDNQLTALVYQNGDNLYRLSYKKDPLYTFRFLIWMLVFILSFVFVYFLGRIYQYYLKRQYEDEKRITSLQVRAIEQQMSPHFTLSILNSIGNLYENHDTQKAQYYFGKYSKLLRITLISSGEIAVPLEDEIQFTQNYLELEQFRLNDGFSFQFIDNQDIPDIKVPKFLVYTFVENAVKHGLFPIQGIREGVISLYLTEKKDVLQITIEDDGVGRIKAKDTKIYSTGKGLSILDEILVLYQRFESKKISYKIEDKYTDREETGTRVIITISNN
ncbi:MAG: hypothetical protein COC06_08115 [Bacteroidales bacterium]|nr:MAG: hypothetical protein COC06_08115 [Bacteroidales bacterium]